MPRGGARVAAICLAGFRFSARLDFRASARTSNFMRFDGRGCSVMAGYVGWWALVGLRCDVEFAPRRHATFPSVTPASLRTDEAGIYSPTGPRLGASSIS